MELLLPEIGLLFWTLLAFLVVFFILKKYGWPAIVKGLNDREASITEALATAEKIKLEMAQMKNDNEAFLVKAREERAIMIKDAAAMNELMPALLNLCANESTQMEMTENIAKLAVNNADEIIALQILQSINRA